MEVVNGLKNHVLGRFNQILDNLAQANLEDVDNLLKYFNGAPVLIDGVIHHPYNDPLMAAQLNARYLELTGQNHPTYLRELPIVANRLLNDEEKLLKAGAYLPSYFEAVASLKQDVEDLTNTSSRH